MSSDKKSFFEKLGDDTKKVLKDVAEKLKAHKIEMAAEPASPVTQAAEMVEGALADGTVIKYVPDANGALGVGSDVVVVTDQGETPAPDGDLTLADGSVATIAAGKVTNVTAKPAEEMNQENVKQVSERVTKIVEKFEAYVSTSDKEKKALKNEIESLKLKVGRYGALISDNSEALLKFAEVETEEPIEQPTVSKKSKALEKLITASGEAKK